MDYLDTAKEFKDQLVLKIGYVLVAIAIVIATDILVNLAYGYNLNTNGAVVQNGLIYFSSQPNPADIYLNGKLQSNTTNTRLLLPSGIYAVSLSRAGYRDWHRTIELDGGKVEHFDYPLLIPKQLTSRAIANYSNPPGFASQSPDRRWLVVEQPGSDSSFDLYDLKDPTKVVVSSLSLPDNIMSKATTSSTLLPLEWADDNQHLLLQHNYDNKSEFIELDRSDATQSINLNTTFSVNPSKVTLENKKFDHYYFYDAAGTLSSDAIGNPAPSPVLNHVLAYQSYSDNTILYVTSDGAPSGQVLIKMRVGSMDYTLRRLPTSSIYLLDLTTYNGSLYVAAGSSTENRVYIYNDPVGQLSSQPNSPPMTTWTLHLPQPNYVSFSANAQFIMAENNSHFAVYDIHNKDGFNYTDTATPLDAPQVNAAWMDGDRLVYTSGGNLIIQDYDNNNVESLIKINPAYPAIFSPDYKYLYSLSPSASNQLVLNQTPLLTPNDL